MGYYHPECKRYDCFAWHAPFKASDGEGVCTVLNDTEFHGKPCPFFKTVEQFNHKSIHKEKKKA